MKDFRCYHIAAGVLLGIMVLGAVVLQYSHGLTDNDIWFTMAYGRYFLENRTIIPDHTIFSWTPAAGGTIYCTWVPSIALYLLHEAGGLQAFFILKYACLLAFILLALSFVQRKDFASVLVSLLIWLCGAVMITSGIRIKAEIFSFGLMTVMAWTWFRVKSSQGSDKGGTFLPYVFPALMLVWVNSHGGFIFGLVFLAAVMAGEIINQITRSPERLSPKAFRHLLAATALSLPAVLVNPYGWRYPAQLLDTLILNPAEFRHHFQTILEYQNIFYPAIRHLLYIDSLAVALAVLVALAALHLVRRRPDWTLILSNAVFIGLYVRYIRTTYFFGILFVFTALYLLRTLPVPDKGVAARKALRNAVQGGLAVVLLVFSLRVGYYAVTSPDLGFRVNYYSPMAEAEYIRSHFPNVTRIGNEYNSGAYLIWSLWPGRKVFIDSRYFPYVQWYDEYQEFMTTQDDAQRQAFLKKHPCDLWVVNFDSAVLPYFISSPQWRLVHYGPSACVFLSNRISHPQGHTVSDSLSKTAFYQASFIARFALDIGDYQVAKNLLTRMEPMPFYPFEHDYALAALLEAGDFLRNRKQFPTASEVLTRAIEIDPDSYHARFMMGDVLMRMNRLEDAAMHLGEAARLEPGSEDAHLALADALAGSGRLQDAAREYSMVLKINPQNSPARTGLGVVMERMKGAPGSKGG